VYPLAAIAIGLAGRVNAREAAVIRDQASTGFVESLIEPSIRILPGVGQNPLPPVFVTQHVAVVVQSLCLPVFVTVSLMIRSSCGYLFHGRAPTSGVRALRSVVGLTRLTAALESGNAGDVACIVDGRPFPFALAINHSLPESVGLVFEPMLRET
jgi:hypothetical protein